MQIVDLNHDQLDAAPDRLGEDGWRRALGQRMQVGDTPDSLGRDQSELGELAPQRVDQRSTLSHQQLARPVQHQARLLLGTLDLDKSHCWPGYGLADRFRIDSIVLAALD
jgi:hypothetical protein